MSARALLELLLGYLLDGRGVDEPVFIEYEGDLRIIQSVDVRLLPDGDNRPRATFIVIVGDGPAHL